MTDRAATWVIITILTVMFWTWVAQTVLGDSRQVCQETASADVCEWSLNR